MAKQKITVHVVKYKTAKFLALRYVDPETGKHVRKSSRTNRQREALRAAARWEEELNSKGPDRTEELTWEDFRDRFETQVVDTLSAGYQSTFNATFNHLETATDIQTLDQLPQLIDAYELYLHRLNVRTNTVRTYLKHLNRAKNWAMEKGYLSCTVKINIPEEQEQQKGRAIKDSEYQQILEAVPGVVGEEQAEHWKNYIRGLWLSGLRRSESVALSWDHDAGFRIDLSGLFPHYRIDGQSQKSRKTQTLPIVPDCAEWLLTTFPPGERSGPVFTLLGQKGQRLTADAVGRTVTEIAKAAGVRSAPGSESYVGCQDFRRTFGTRWAKRIMPAELKDLMRHANIETTMKYYVSQCADDKAASLYARFGNNYGTTPAEAETVPKP